MRKHTPAYDKLANELANYCEGNFDYAYGETPVIDLADSPWIEMDAVNETQYDAISAACAGLIIDRDAYTVTAAYSDVSGYDYWKNNGDSMTVNITADIKNITAINAADMYADMVAMRDNVYDIIIDVTEGAEA